MIKVRLYVKDNDGDDEMRETFMPAIPRVGDIIWCFELFQDVWIDGFEELTPHVVKSIDWSIGSGNLWYISVMLDRLTDEQYNKMIDEA